MALTTLAYLIAFALSVLGTFLYHPMVGMMAYLFTYHINPLAQWWATGLPEIISRYSLFLAIVTFLGMLFHFQKLSFKNLLDSQEMLLIMYVLATILSVSIGLGGNESIASAVKMTKICVILLMASHLITTFKRYEIMVLVLIFASLYLGVQTYNAPSYHFSQGRFQSGIGGPDFSDGNILSGHFLMILPMMGIMLIKGGWKVRLLCLLATVFSINGIILIKSRGAFLAIIACFLGAIIFAKNVGRKRIAPYLIIGLIGGIYLLDPGYLLRMQTIDTDVEKMDPSAVSRLEMWKIALRMALDQPLGVGAGNYEKVVANYNPDLEGKDTHNTYLRCLAELGFQGFLVLLMLIINALRTISAVDKRARLIDKAQAYFWHTYALKLSYLGYLVVIFFVSATYVEDFFWFLFFPLFLKRSIENESFQTDE